MSFTVSIWWIPSLLTVMIASIMLRPYKRAGDYDFGAIERVMWLPVIVGVWAGFFAFLYFSGAPK